MVADRCYYPYCRKHSVEYNPKLCLLFPTGWEINQITCICIQHFYLLSRVPNAPLHRWGRGQMPTKHMSFERAVTVLVHKENLDNSQGQRNECIDRNFSIAGDNF